MGCGREGEPLGWRPQAQAVGAHVRCLSWKPRGLSTVKGEGLVRGGRAGQRVNGRMGACGNSLLTALILSVKQ